MDEGLRNLLGGGSLVLLFIFSLADAALRLFARSKLERKVTDPEARERIRQRLVDLAPLKVTARTLRILCLIVLVTCVAAGADWSKTEMSAILSVLIISVPIALLLVEVLPHGIAGSRPESTVRWTLPIIYPLSRLIGPLGKVSGVIASWLRRAPEDGSHAIEEGILSAAEEARREGVLDEVDRAMIENIMEFRDVQVAEVMTPRIDIFAIDVGTAMRETLRLVQRTSHSRIPVYSGNRDMIVGILYVKDLLRQIDNETIDEIALRDMLRKPLFIPETKHISDLLREFQSKKIHMAVVVDEYGGTSGVVTIEDIIEEIVGEIEDEYDTAQFSPMKRISDNVVEIDAKVHIDHLNEQLGLGLPEDDDFETLGGFVFYHMGKVPKVGEEFHHEGMEFTILEADERRINRLKLVMKR